MFNARHYLQAILYHMIPQFSSLKPFLDYVCSDLEEESYDKKPVLQLIKSTLEVKYVEEGKITEKPLRYLVQQDIRLVQSLLNDDSIVDSIEEEINQESILYETLEIAITELAMKGIEVKKPQLRIVDMFPKPYEKMDFIALNLDLGDSIEHGVEPGIYFLRSNLRPIYSRYVLLHELIHTFLGQKDPFLLARGLEEGICELIGNLYLSEAILGQQLTKNLFIYNRLFYGASDHYELYLDHFRQATFLLNSIGYEGMFNLLKKGRSEIKKIEDIIWNDPGKLAGSHLSNNNHNEYTLANSLALIFNNHSVVSPNAKYVSQFVKPGLTIKEISKVSNLSDDVVVDAIEELQSLSTFAVLRQDKSVVSFSDCDRLNNNMMLRYKI